MRALRQRVVRRGERQLLDDDQAQRVAFDVHAFPEARGAEQHRVAGLAETAQQLFARRLALHQQRKVADLGPALAQQLRRALQRAMAGEQHERAAGRRLDQRHATSTTAGGVRRRRRIRQLRR